MALTRKLLKGMGLTDEQVDTIIEAHTDTVDGLKAEVARYKPDAEKLADVQKELNELKAISDGGFKQKYEDEHKAFEDYKREQTAKESRDAKKDAYKSLLKEVGVSEKRLDAVLKVSDIDAIELDKDGNIKGADKLKDSVKSEWADFITTTTTQGATTSNPPTTNGGNTTLTKADIYKKDEKGRYVMSTSERQKALAENPDILR